MYEKMVARRPSDELPFHNTQGRRIEQTPAPSKDVWWTKADMPAFVLHSPQGTDQGHGAYDMSGLAKEAAMLHVRSLVIVHFFSGFRRHGDIHTIIDHHVQRTGAQIFTISVDLCMQRQHADLATAQAAKWWTASIHAGQVVSAGGGPPCETFTIARRMDDDGPRPLRSRDHPQGLPGLTRKEWAQVHISNKLLRFMLEILHALAATGYSGFLEHPQYPTWLQSVTSASIWTMEVVRHMKRMHCVTVVSFDQCTCGALGRKPTTLLLVRLPEVRHRLLLQGDWGRCNHEPGRHGPLIGRQQDGTFQTSKAKIYPEGLNDIIGTAMFRFALQHDSNAVESTLPQDFFPYLEQSFQAHDTVQPDFHGS